MREDGVDEAPETVETPEPSDIPPDGEADMAMETDLQVSDAVSQLGQIENIQPAPWQALDGEGRLAALQGVENSMAGIQGRPALDVVPHELDPGVFGAFDGQRLLVNANDLPKNELPADEFVNTVVHEGRHAYQQFVVENPGTLANSATVSAWAENMQPGNYLSAEMYGQDAYQSQPIEADAWSFADRITNQLASNRLAGTKA